MKYFLLLFFSTFLFSAELFLSRELGTTVKLGETIEVNWILKYQPGVELFNESEVLKFDIKELGDKLHFSNINRDSEMLNGEVAGVLSITPLEVFDPDNFSIKSDNLYIKLNFSNIKFDFTPVDGLSAFTIIQDANVQNRNSFYFYVFLIYILIFALIGFRYFYQKIQYIKELKSKKSAYLEKQNYFYNLISSAKDRVSIERIYLERASWQPFFNVNSELLESFFDELNKHQFKMKWTEREFTSVKSKLIKLQDSIRQNNGI